MIDLGRWESMAKPNYQYEKRQKDLAKQRKKQEKEQEKALRKANKTETHTSGDTTDTGESVVPAADTAQESPA